MITKMWKDYALRGQREQFPVETCDICDKYVVHCSAFEIPMYYQTLPTILYNIYVNRKAQICNLDLASRLYVFQATVHNNERFYFV